MIKQKYSLLAKSEDTYLTDPTPATGDAVEAWDVSFQPVVSNLDKNISYGSHGAKASYANIGTYEVTFKTYVKATGTVNTTESMFGKLLQGCGFSSTYVDSTSYTYVYTTPASQEGVTLYFYRDGLRKEINGARGVFTSMKFIAGNLAEVEWRFIGKYVAPTATAIVAPTFEAGSAYIVESGDFEFGAANNIDGIETFTLSQAGLEMFGDINNAEGFGSAKIVDALFTGTVDPEVTTTDITTWHTAINASTTYAFNFVQGSAGSTGNTITITGPAVQIMNIQEADRRGMVTANLDLAFRVTSGDSDPLKITIT